MLHWTPWQPSSHAESPPAADPPPQAAASDPGVASWLEWQRRWCSQWQLAWTSYLGVLADLVPAPDQPVAPRDGGPDAATAEDDTPPPPKPPRRARGAARTPR